MGPLISLPEETSGVLVISLSPAPQYSGASLGHHHKDKIIQTDISGIGQLPQHV